MTAAEILTKQSYADGEAKGIAKGKAELLLQQMSLRFGSLSTAQRETVFRASPEQLDVWAERVITGASLEEILA